VFQSSSKMDWILGMGRSMTPDGNRPKGQENTLSASKSQNIAASPAEAELGTALREKKQLGGLT
jgi:hypothetical protein